MMRIRFQVKKQILCLLFSCMLFAVFTTEPVKGQNAEMDVKVQSPSAILMEASTGQVIYERDADTKRSPASITKIMTLILIFDELKSGNLKLDDEVTTSAYAKSMGGSQVFLEEGEVQTVETMIKCIVVASANDASVAMAEKICGSEEAFVERMNARAKELGMTETHFCDCCGLTSDEQHYTSARDVALMSRELITKYPEIYRYTKIWMEDITHVTQKGSTPFTLSSTNKLLKQYEYTTGLKTGSTSVAKYCFSATAHKDGIDLIAVVMAAPDHKVRFADAKTLLTYGFSVCSIYHDANTDTLPKLKVKGGVEDTVSLRYDKEFRYLDLNGQDMSGVTKKWELSETVPAPATEGEKAGEAVYYLGEQRLGSVDILYAQTVEQADYGDCIKKVFLKTLL
ncbi:MAG: D-alanyl-D-alanine carboxypeptidase [Firmicutes bacterium CAG_194_44_15]|nr:MAG: D-alanyl-D-alanine carboxypeptidase [Firmicutes bacterium CAG_194_44_15]